MLQQLLPSFRIVLAMTALTGLIYPAALTGLCQMLFRDRANGSLIQRNGLVAGSKLIGQRFTRPEYFHPRPSAAGSDGYDAMASGGSNLGPTSKKLVERVHSDVERFRKENPDYTGPIPADAVTASASGLDPEVSPATAEIQVARVAAARQVDAGRVRELVRRNTRERTLGFMGEPRVNVLTLNLDLDRELAR
jgi:potassium-transporting ATPase KdpC subunit